jgi:hypothetical protein
MVRFLLKYAIFPLALRRVGVRSVGVPPAPPRRSKMSGSRGMRTFRTLGTTPASGEIEDAEQPRNGISPQFPAREQEIRCALETAKSCCGPRSEVRRR